MKKKTKFKLRNSFFLPFINAIFICFLGATLNSLFFYKSFFRALTKLNEEPIATITFKYKTAQRKFLDRVVWDRLRQNSPVYNGDTIHTSSLSQATIWFSDGNIMDLSENTMAQVFLSEDKSLRAELSGGEAFIDSTDADGGMTLTANGVSLQLEKGSSLSAKNASSDEAGGASDVSVQVVKGSASVVSDVKGEKLAVQAGEALVVKENGNYQEPSLVLSSPKINERILYYSKENYEIPFSWNFNFNDLDKQKQNSVSYELTVSKDKNFSQIAYQNSFENQTDVKVPLEEGNYWWKLSAKFLESAESAESSSSQSAKSSAQKEKIYVQTGKFHILQSLSPELLVPAENFEYSYRTRNPAVRLIWTEAAYASSYRLEISNNADFSPCVIDTRLSLASAIISTLSEGVYFWRVTPYYTINKIGLASTSKTGSFIITKKGELSEPKLMVPAENGIINTELAQKGAAFSWKMEDEATKYTLRISDSEDFSHSIVTEETSDNHFLLNPKTKKLKDGKYYWSVSYEDVEGNISPASTVRSFYAMKGSPSQHTIEPVEGFRAAASMVPDTKFTWKKNLPEDFVTVFELAADSEFTNIITSQETYNTSVKGINLNPGTYFWRIRSFNKTTDLKLVTPAKSFVVLGPLEKPVLKVPFERAVARETIPFTFEWDEVEEADFYKFAIYKAGSSDVLFEENVYDTKIAVDLFNPKEFVDKSYYRYTVQAQSVSIPGLSTRRTGKLAERVFFLVKLRPVEVSIKGYSGKNIKIKGEDAILNPVTAKWTSLDSVKEAQFVLTKIDEEPNQIIIKTPSDEEAALGKISAKEILLDTKDGLNAGKYEIIVYAKTFDEIDISNTDSKHRFRFTVLPVPPLEEAKNLKASPELFNMEYLRVKENPKNIKLSWNKISQATEYFVSIKDKKGNTVLERTVNEAEYTIDFAKLPADEKSKFSKGKFTWSVKGVRRIDSDKDGTLDKKFQESPEAESVFETDIPSTRKTKTKGAANPYGKQSKKNRS